MTLGEKNLSVSNRRPKALTLKEKTDKLDFINILKILPTRNSKRMKIFPKAYIGQGLISRIYKKLPPINKKIRNNSIKEKRQKT